MKRDGDQPDVRAGALDRLDELVDPIRVDGEEEGVDACVFALEKMATSAMKADALRDAHRLHYLRDEMRRAAERGGPVKVPPSYALRLSVKLHEYRRTLCESGDEEGAESVARVIRVIDGKIAGRG